VTRREIDQGGRRYYNNLPDLERQAQAHSAKRRQTGPSTSEKLEKKTRNQN
jgi:hypothetical protein